MTIYGWDASHYDAPQVASAVADGITFITHKAGGDRLDDELDEWWANARGLDPSRVLLGAYWVLYPGRPVERADAFLARLDAVCVGWRDRPFILQVDCEKWGGDPATVPDLAEIRAFCDRLVERTGGKYRPIVYAPKWVYGDSLKGLPYPLWASSYVSGTANYRALYPGDTSSRWGAYSGQTPAILQYTSSATIGNQTTCDANAFRGTLAQLTALVTGQPEENDVTPEELMKADIIPWDATKQYTLGGAIWDGTAAAKNADGRTTELLRQVTAMRAELAALAGKDFTDEPAIVAGVLAGLPPEAIAAAIPAGMAKQVADELAARLQG